MPFYTRSAGGRLRGRVGGGFRLLIAPAKSIIDVPVDGSTVALFAASFENADTVASLADQEMSFGQEFAPGDVPAGTRVRVLVDGVPIPCQVSNRRVWSDGSLKVADIRVLVPSIPAGGAKAVTWERVPGDWSVHDAPLHTTTAAVTSKVALEYAFPTWKGRDAANVLTAEKGPKVFRSNDMLAAGNAPWIDVVMAGPVCCEWRASDTAAVPGGKDDNFGALLYVRAWGGTTGNPKRIQFLYRTIQGWSTDIPADEQGSRVDINLNVNGTTVRGAAIGTAGWSAVNTWKGGFLVSAGTEGVMDWYDVATSSWITPPKLVYRRNITYGVKAKFVPPIDTSNSAFPMAATASSYSPGRRGPLRPDQSDVADHAMLAWTTSKPMVWNIAAHARATAAQIAGHQRYARAAAWGMGAMTCIGLHRTTRKIISYLPTSKQTNEGTLGPSIYGMGKPAQAAENLRWANGGTAAEIKNLDGSHFPQMAFWPALDGGDQHFLDLAYTEATLPGLFTSPADGFYGTSAFGGTSVQYGGVTFTDQIRATSHNARPIGNALGLGNPADPHWVMVRDYFDHWSEMVGRITEEEDAWRGGTAKTDGRRFQDLKLLPPNNEPTYKIWMHTIGLGAMAYNFGVTEYTKVKESAEWFAHAPTVMAGGYHNDTGPEYYLMKPDPIECIGYEQIAMDGLTSARYPNTAGSANSGSEYRRFWKFGQWTNIVRPCTYKADGQSVVMSGTAYGAATMLDGMIITVSTPRGSEPHWGDGAQMPPLGLTPGTIYYSVQTSGLTIKLSLTPGGAPVTFTTTGGVDQAGWIFRTPVGGIHPMKPGSEVPSEHSASNAYLSQIKASLDMVAHYCLPADPRLRLARQKLAALKAGTTNPNGWDERAKTTVPDNPSAAA
jgi:hypothetical protein